MQLLRKEIKSLVLEIRARLFGRIESQMDEHVSPIKVLVSKFLFTGKIDTAGAASIIPHIIKDLNCPVCLCCF